METLSINVSIYYWLVYYYSLLSRPTQQHSVEVNQSQKRKNVNTAANQYQSRQPDVPTARASLKFQKKRKNPLKRLASSRTCRLRRRIKQKKWSRSLYTLYWSIFNKQESIRKFACFEKEKFAKISRIFSVKIRILSIISTILNNKIWEDKEEKKNEKISESGCSKGFHHQ